MRCAALRVVLLAGVFLAAVNSVEGSDEERRQMAERIAALSQYSWDTLIARTVEERGPSSDLRRAAELYLEVARSFVNDPDRGGEFIEVERDPQEDDPNCRLFAKGLAGVLAAVRSASGKGPIGGRLTSRIDDSELVPFPFNAIRIWTAAHPNDRAEAVSLYLRVAASWVVATEHDMAMRRGLLHEAVAGMRSGATVVRADSSRLTLWARELAAIESDYPEAARLALTATFAASIHALREWLDGQANAWDAVRRSDIVGWLLRERGFDGPERLVGPAFAGGTWPNASWSEGAIMAWGETLLDSGPTWLDGAASVESARDAVRGDGSLGTSPLAIMVFGGLLHDIALLRVSRLLVSCELSRRQTGETISTCLRRNSQRSEFRDPFTEVAFAIVSNGGTVMIRSGGLTLVGAMRDKLPVVSDSPNPFGVELHVSAGG